MAVRCLFKMISLLWLNLLWRYLFDSHKITAMQGLIQDFFARGGGGGGGNIFIECAEADV